MNARNRKAMLEGADANEGFIDMLPTGPFIRRKPRMMTAQDMANDPMFIDAMAAKGGRIMKTKKGGKAVKGFAKKKKQANKMRKNNAWNNDDEKTYDEKRWQSFKES